MIPADSATPIGGLVRSIFTIYFNDLCGMTVLVGEWRARTTAAFVIASDSEPIQTRRLWPQLSLDCFDLLAMTDS
jgi:hypothetical protein